MKKTFTLILFAFVMQVLSAQQVPYERDLQLGTSLANSGDCNGAMFHLDNVLLLNEHEETVLLLKGGCLINQSKYADARKSLQTAYEVNSGYYRTLILLALLDIEQFANLNNAQKKIDEAAALLLNETEYNDAVSILNTYKNRSSYPEDYDPLLTRLRLQFEKNGKGDINQQKEAALTQGIEALENQQLDKAIEHFNKIVTLFDTQGPETQHNLVQTLSGLGEIYRQYGQVGEALRYAEMALQKYSQSGIKNHLLLGNVVSRLGSLYTQTGAYAKALALFEKWEPELAKGNYPTSVADLMVNRISTYINMFYADNSEAGNKLLLSEADKLYNFTSQVHSSKSPFYYAIAEHTRAIFYYKVWPATAYPDKHIAKAKEWADKAGNDQLSREIDASIGLIKKVAITEITEKDYEKRAEEYLSLNQYTAAITEYNNVAALRIKNDDFTAAIPMLQKAVVLVEKYRLAIPAEGRMAFLDAQASVYNGLILCYAIEGKSKLLYEILESSRGRVLSESISTQNGFPFIDHTTIQNTLQPDEIAVMYGVLDLGIICMVLITEDTILCKMVDRSKQFENLYKTLPAQTDKFNTYDPYSTGNQPPFTHLLETLRYCMQDGGKNTQLNTTLSTILTECYNLLIQPIASYIVGKSSLIICPDAQLSFLPFDALIAPSKNYLAEQISIRYVPSMSVYKKLTERKFIGHTKNILAFGGAEYAPYNLPLNPPKNLSEFVLLQDQVQKNFTGKLSQRTAFSKLGIIGKSWTYLPGTLTEIQNIQSAIPNVEIYSGADFSEVLIKEMSANGNLSRYRVLHFATHGITVPSLPELSCIVTTLSDPELGREDGYLTAYEIAQLRMQADFVALSACETGLGKVYAGEGVSGFVSALMIAGSNGISVSHWAINDYATMLFMSGLYDIKFKQNTSFSTAMSEMKKAFIRGDHGQQFRHPNYWAPFAYYGL